MPSCADTPSKAAGDEEEGGSKKEKKEKKEKKDKGDKEEKSEKKKEKVGAACMCVC